MAPKSGTEIAPVAVAPGKFERLERELRNDIWTFDFFQAVRLLERLRPDRGSVGTFTHPSREVVRFGANTSIAFPASRIQEMQWSDSSAPFMVVNFMGLTGPMGVLPLYYSELLRQRIRDKDRTLQSFFDLFNHRMISLFYQAWEKYRFQVAYERGERDRFSHHLLDLIGLGTRGLADRQAVNDDSLIFYCGLLSQHPRSVSALRNMLIDYFDVPVEIEQFVGAWYALDPDNQCRFDVGDSFSEQLGVGAVAGDEIWDQQSGLRVTLGPLSLNEYLDFLPQGSAYAPLQALTKFFVGNHLEIEIQLVLKREEVPACELDDIPAEAGDKIRPQLGWVTWAKSAPMGRDPGDTILRI
jgi:type VI secretion system protein ImpH